MSSFPAWFEHHSEDSESSQTFYGKLLHAKTDPTDMGDHKDYTATVGDDGSFGIIQSFKGLEGYRGWLPFFAVEHLASEKDRGLALGAELVAEDPGGEHYGPWCIFKDPQGLLFALYQDL
jgi:predicted enzyme related to lactoylglutathione lyase